MSRIKVKQIQGLDTLSYYIPTSGNTFSNIANAIYTTTISATTYYNLPTDIRVTGGTYNTGTATFTNNTGGTFNVSGFFKTTDDIYTTGMTFNNGTYYLSIDRNDGTSFTQSLAILASDMTVTGGTYNGSTGVATFTNNSGGTFNVSGFLTGMTDTYTTGVTFNNNILTIQRNAGQPDINTLINNFSGLTVNGTISATTISATTYQNLPADLWTQSGTSIYYNTGKVGIGITNPTREFEVLANTETFYTDLTNVDGVAASISSTDLSKRVRFGAINSGSSVSIGQIGTTATGSTGYGSQGDSYLFSSTAANNLNIITQNGIGTEDNIKFFAGNIATATPSMIIVGSGATKGFVGIGTASPTNTLQIHGNPTASIRLQETGSGGNKRLDLSIDGSATARISANQSAQSMAFDTAGSERIRITKDGDVGIGTTVPSTKLHVSGNTLISGGLTATTLSATTYLNLPTDIRVTGGTHSSGVTTFRNNTGGTFTVSGFSTGNTTLYLYAESSTIPSVGPIVNGTNSIALGGNAQALASDMFVYGQYAGNGTTGATYSNFIGYYAGKDANDSTTSNFIGNNAGQGVNNFTNSNFIGNAAGYYTSNSSQSNFIGFETGRQSSGNTTSNFFGYRAGYFSINNPSGLFIGSTAGYQATGATSSNFIGNQAGYQSSASLYSNMLGFQAGYQSNTSTYSNILGYQAGYSSTTTSYSNFIGFQAGRDTTGVTYSNLFGYYAGETFAGNNIGSNNIVIGTNISLPNATTNSINIGGVLFGTNTYSTTTGNPSITPTSTGRIGIGIVTPSERLHVSGNTLITGNLNVSGNTNVRGLTGTSATISGTGQNILTVIGSGNSTSSPLFSVQGSSGELFSVTDSLTGSLFSVNDISGLPIVEVFSDNTMLVGSYQAPALNTTVKIVLTAGTNTIYSIPTSAYTGSFIDYTVISSGATGARAGTIMSIWSGTTAQYTDVSTNDIGTTAGITFSVSVVGNNAVLSSSATTAGWTLKTIIRSI